MFRKTLLGLLVIAVGLLAFSLLLLAVYHFPKPLLVLVILINVLGIAYMIGDMLTDLNNLKGG